MSDNPRPSSQEVDRQIASALAKNEVPMPRLLGPANLGPANFVAWVDDALAEAQEIKEIALGRRPPKVVAQPNPAVSSWQHVWKTAHMNNNRELGPGDTKKK
jgi:hypothetical protein